MPPCQVDSTRIEKTAFHTGRPLYRVECMIHGLVHPGTTWADWHVEHHLSDPEYVWPARTPDGQGDPR